MKGKTDQLQAHLKTCGDDETREILGRLKAVTASVSGDFTSNPPFACD